MSKHTPGPWKFVKDFYGETNELSGFNVETEGQSIVGREGIEAWQENGEANARLIAAAPDLLHACRLIIENAPLAADWLERNDIGAYKQVKAAITKATGHD